MTGRELSRVEGADGYTTVAVALGSDRQGALIVPTDLLDTPGYQAMLDAYTAKHDGLVALRDGGVPL